MADTTKHNAEEYWTCRVLKYGPHGGSLYLTNCMGWAPRFDLMLEVLDSENERNAVWSTKVGRMNDPAGHAKFHTVMRACALGYWQARYEGLWVLRDVADFWQRFSDEEVNFPWHPRVGSSQTHDGLRKLTLVTVAVTLSNTRPPVRDYRSYKMCANNPWAWSAATSHGVKKLNLVVVAWGASNLKRRYYCHELA